MNDSLENRLFLGKIIPGKDFNQNNNLIEIAGIFYHYHLDNNEHTKNNLNCELLAPKEASIQWLLTEPKDLF